MGKIRILPESIANKIAAGEVVERPASVVKELVENAIDATASVIKIEIEEGGIKKIVVTDNGTGMDKEDIQKCFKLHGTSKISTEEDLEKIKSMGFRGEALSSITAISTITIRSKIPEATVGQEIKIKEGKVIQINSVGMPAGTQIVVENIFDNVPARKKFLRSQQTEFRYILEIFTNIALAFPEKSFTLSHNKKALFNIPKNQSLDERIKILLGETLFSNLIPVFFDHPHLKISGYTTRPQGAIERSHKQYIFVNQRRVNDRIISSAVKQAYETLLPPKSYPVFILFLKISPEVVDINVHPRKEEVRFTSSNFIYNCIKEAVAHALQKADLTFSPISQFLMKNTKIRPFTQPQFKRSSLILKDKPRQITPQYLLTWEEKEAIGPTEVIQIHNLYLILQSPEGVLFLDQHAAHERILYENLLEEYNKKTAEKNSQPLLLTTTFELSVPEAALLKENLITFKNLGLEIEEFGRNSFKINSIPAILQGKDIVCLINEVLGDLTEDKAPKKIDSKSLRAISFLACRSAVKAGDCLNSQMRHSIIEKLAKTQTEYTCPHGRPVKIEITLHELAKMFKRR